jgi:hypothetical protein
MRIGGEVASSGSGLAVMQVKIRRGCSFGVPLMTSPDVNLDPAVGNAAEHITAPTQVLDLPLAPAAPTQEQLLWKPRLS